MRWACKEDVHIIISWFSNTLQLKFNSLLRTDTHTYVSDLIALIIGQVKLEAYAFKGELCTGYNSSVLLLLKECNRSVAYDILVLVEEIRIQAPCVVLLKLSALAPDGEVEVTLECVGGVTFENLKTVESKPGGSDANTCKVIYRNRVLHKWGIFSSNNFCFRVSKSITFHDVAISHC